MAKTECGQEDRGQGLQDGGEGFSLVLVSGPQGPAGGVSFAQNERATYWGRDSGFCTKSVT